MKPIRVAKRAPAIAVAPAGWHSAVVRAAAEGDDGVPVLTWRFTVGRKAWTLEQQLPPGGERTRVLIGLGMAGRTITSLDILVGLRARIYVRTRGGQRSAFVFQVEPDTEA